MSKRLSRVVVQKTKKGCESSFVITTISDLGYKHKAYLSESLWRLKLGEWLNDDVINVYLELLQRSRAADQSIKPIGILSIKPNSP
jgi:Ulp1 family protease